MVTSSLDWHSKDKPIINKKIGGYWVFYIPQSAMQTGKKTNFLVSISTVEFATVNLSLFFKLDMPIQYVTVHQICRKLNTDMHPETLWGISLITEPA